MRRPFGLTTTPFRSLDWEYNVGAVPWVDSSMFLEGGTILAEALCAVFGIVLTAKGLPRCDLVPDRFMVFAKAFQVIYLRIGSQGTGTFYLIDKCCQVAASYGLMILPGGGCDNADDSPQACKHAASVLQQ